MNNDADVIVLGAGLAGLAAARALSASGKSVLVLESRDRTGGRVFTQRDPATPFPIELGPEWVGATGALRALLEPVGGDLHTTYGAHLVRLNGALEVQENWQEMDGLMRRLRAVVQDGDDLTLEEALKACCTADEVPEGRASLLSYVQGFNAADPARVSTRWLLEVEDNEPPEASEAHALGGLDLAIRALTDSLGVNCTLKLNSIVRRVRWSGGSGGSSGGSARVNDARVHDARVNSAHVEVDADVDGSSRTFAASQLICTLPVSVLKLRDDDPSAVIFSPPLTEKRASLQLLEMGPVTKIVFVFDEPFWRRIDTLKTASFVQARELPVPTWWTTHPIESSVITGWAAGPLRQSVAVLSGEALIDVSLQSLATALGVPRARLDQALRGAHTHDWCRDPFALGGYSYVLCGGTGAGAELAKPLQHTLFFAGEATCGHGHNATMEGALQSGMRAARELLGDTASPRQTQ